MSCKNDKPELEYLPERLEYAMYWVPDMLHTHGYGEVVIADQVEYQASVILKAMKERGLLAPAADPEALAKGIGQAAAHKVAFYWHDKKPPHEHGEER